MANYDDFAQADMRPGHIPVDAAPQPAGDPYESLASQEAAQSYDRLKQTLGVALKQDPDTVAKRKGLADRSGVPLPVVERNEEIVQIQQRAKEVQAAVAQSPILARQMSDPAFAALAHDATEGLSAVEQAVRQLTGGPRSLAAGLLTDFNASAWGLAEGGARLVGAQNLGGFAKEMRQQQEALGKSIQGDFGSGGLVEAGVASGFRSFGAMLPATLASVLTGSPQFMLASGAVQAGGQATGKGLEAGLSPGRALLYGAQDAVAEYATEMIPVGRLFKDLKAGTPFLKLLGRQMVTEVPTEMAATAWQNFNEWANINPQKSLEDYAKELGPAEAQTVIATVVQTILSAGMASGAAKLSRRYEGDRAAAAQAQEAAGVLQQIGALAAANKLRERDPKSFEQFAAAAAEDGPVQEVYLNAQALQQSGIDMQALAQASPAVATQLAEAVATGGDIVIPVAEYAARVAGTDLDAALTPHLRTSEEGLSLAEIPKAEEQVKLFQAAAEKAMGEHEQDVAWRESAKAVETNLLDQLKQAGRFTNDVNTAYATLMRDFYVATAQRLGVTPGEMFQRYPLRIKAEGVEGEQRLSQITPEQAMRTNVPREMPSDPLFAESVGNTPGAQITEDGLLIDLVRYQKAEQEGAQAVRTGVFYLPAKSADVRHYRNAKTGYGGSERFAGATLIRRPLFVKGATGGAAPGQAYTQIKGKEAMKELEGAVLHVVTRMGYWGKTNADKLQLIEEFLDQYAPEQSGQGSEIARVSDKGNTLRYALQELAIAQAVREAGYDAVVGYSKKKTGPAISEVFDVREQTFPARGMDSQVHEAFNQDEMSAAERAGFDTSQVWLHGTTKDFKGFKVGKGGVDELGPGIYFTKSPTRADAWSGAGRAEAGRTVPAIIKKGDIFDKAKPVDYLALAQRLKKENPVSEAEKRAKEIRETKDVAKWTAEESRIVNDTSTELWRSWLLESDQDLADQIKKGEINTWLDRAGYIGAKNENSQVPDQVVVFRPENIRSPWAKFDPKKAGSTNLLAQAPLADPTAPQDIQKAKANVRTALQEAATAGDIPERAAFRGLYAEELAEIARTGQLAIRSNAEGEAVISAVPVTAGKADGAIYGAGSGYVVDQAQTTPSGSVGEVHIDPKTDAKSAKYIVQGKLLSFDEMKKEVLGGAQDTTEAKAASDWLKQFLGADGGQGGTFLQRAVGKVAKAMGVETQGAEQPAAVAEPAGPALDMGQFFQGTQERDLIIQHNLTTENLLNAVKVGGLAAPSLAVTRADNAVTGFGEITLLGDAGTATPGGDTKVFGADIYSPRYPSIEYKLDAAALRDLNARLAPFAGDREIYGGEISKIDDLVSNKAFQRFTADKLGESEPNAVRYHDLQGVASALLTEIGATERIFQGYTNNGNRRYIPHTLDNVVRILKRDLRGGENFNYGVGSVRARYTPQFRSLSAIRKEKNRLVSREDFEIVKKEVDEEFFKIGDALRSFHPASNSFGYANAVSLMMGDAAKMGLPKALDANGFEGVTPEAMGEVRDYLNKLRSLPTEYFEAKITRAVDISEFAAAVVPSDITPEARTALEKARLHIYEYERGDDTSRRAAVKKAAGEWGLFFQPPTNQEGNRAEISFARDVTAAPSVITLFKTADLSSFLHEMGHFQLEVLAHIASQPNAPQGVVDDLNEVLKWFGITGTEAGVDPVGVLSNRTPSRVYTPEELTAIDEAVRRAESPRNAAKSLTDTSLRDLDPVALAYAISDLRATAEARTPLEVWQAMSLEEKRPYHEQFARGFEAYLFEGKAPSAELDGIFARVRAWLVNVYKSIQALNVEINPEIRKVFDRLVATQDAIEQAEAVRSYAPLFTEAPGNLNPAEWEQYQHLASEATQKAITELQGRSLRDMKWLGNARGRILKQLQADAKDKRKAVEAEVRAEVRAMPVYAAQRFLKRGEITTDTGEQIQAAKGHRLDNAALAEMYPDTMLARPDLDGLRGMTRTDGLHPDLVAEMFGYTSGDHLVREILDAQPEAQVIEGMTDQRVLERYGDLANPDTIARAADEAIHNEARARFVATELKALTAAEGPVRAMTKAAKDFAEMLIARKKLRDIKPNQHATAETRAAKAAQKALAAGDTAQAAVEKRNQLVQNYATRTAYDALSEVDKAVKYLRKFDSEGTRKNLDGEYLDQIDQLRERYDLRTSTPLNAGQKRASLLAWVESQREQGFEPDIPQELITEAQRKPYREMTLEEMRGLVDTVKQIEHLGRLKRKLLTAKDAREFQAIRDQIAASIEEHAKGVRDLRTRNTTGAMLADAGNRFLAMHRKMASVAREMDGFQDGGPMWEYLIRSMNDAGNRETSMRADATARLHELLKPLLAAGPLGGKGQYFATLGGSYNREERIAIALNMGNEGNMQRLLDGEGWTLDRLQPLLDTITPQEADFVQGVWDFFETYRPEIAAKETRIYGKEPVWVDPAPITLAGRALRGGYYPIKYDTNRSGRAEQFAEAEAAKQQMRGAFTSATTRRSFTKARADEVSGRPLLYSFSGVYQGTNEVIHDLAWHEWLIDANRLVRSLDAPIRAHYGPETVSLFKKAIEDIAAGDVPAQNVFERGINHLRVGATVTGLGWNISTAMLQPFGLTQSMVRIGPGWVAKGLGQWIKSPIDTGNEVQEKSTFMRDRARTMQREINEIQNQVRGSKLDPVRGTFFLFIQKMQMVADMPTWLGAYEKAIADGTAEDRAVALADQAVLDAQGGGQIKDLAQIQRGGPMFKLWTNFYSFFNTTYQLTVEKTKEKIGTPKMYPSLALDYLLLYTVPSVMVTLLKAALQGEADDEDKLVKKLVADHLSYLLGTMVGLREITAAVQKVAGVEQFKGSYGGPAGLRLLQEIDKLATQTAQGDADAAWFKAANNVAGNLFHYPSGQVNRTVEGAAAMIEGKTANPAALVFGPPRE